MASTYEQNRAAWDAQVRAGNEWTQPFSAETIARARRGDWSVVLTPIRPVPRAWFGELESKDVLGPCELVHACPRWALRESEQEPKVPRGGGVQEHRQ